jgi:hypothetical protein
VIASVLAEELADHPKPKIVVPVRGVVPVAVARAAVSAMPGKFVDSFRPSQNYQGLSHTCRAPVPTFQGRPINGLGVY